MSKFKRTLALLVCSALIVSTCLATAQHKITTKTPPEEESVRKFLQTKAEDKDTRYILVFRDLNGDGIPEAIAYLVGNEWCGSGGCNLFILRKNGNSWKVVTSVTITRPPVRELNGTSNGWHNIGVQVGGGGIIDGYDAELRFNGKSYPRNPTVPPARRANKDATGKVIIPSFANAKPLF
jgi:hypothetical protein